MSSDCTGKERLEKRTMRFIRITTKEKTYKLKYKKHMVRRLSQRDKVTEAKEAIKEYYEFFGGMVFMQYGGGIASDVLKAIAENECGYKIQTFYLDNGLDYPEIRQYALDKADVVIYPKRTFTEEITRDGYPIHDARLAHAIMKYKGKRASTASRMKMFEEITGINPRHYDTEEDLLALEKECEILNTDFCINRECCYHMFSHAWERKISDTRRAMISPLNAFDNRGVFAKFREECKCNYYADYGEGGKVEGRDVGFKHARSYPLASWSRADMLRYIVEHNVEYCKEFYGDIVLVKKVGKEYYKKYKTTKRYNSKCMFCPNKYHKVWYKNNFEVLKESYPELYKYLMEGGQYKDEKWIPSKKGIGYRHIAEFLNNTYAHEGLGRY